MAIAPPFDPTKPFEVLPELPRGRTVPPPFDPTKSFTVGETPVPNVPAFDPNKPFEVVPTAPNLEPLAITPPTDEMQRRLRGLVLPSETAEDELAARKFRVTPGEVAEARTGLQAIKPPVSALEISALQVPSRQLGEASERLRKERLAKVAPFERDALLADLTEDYLRFSEAPEGFLGGLQKATAGEGGYAKAFPFAAGIASSVAKQLRNEVLEKQVRGEAISKNERAMLNAMAIALRRAHQETGNWEQAAEITGVSLPYAAEFALTGGVYRGVRAAAGPVLGRIGGVLAQTAVASGPRIADEYLDRMAPTWHVDKETLRQTIDNEQADKDWAAELAKAGGSIVIENLSERTGRLLGIPFQEADKLLGLNKTVARVMRLGAIKAWMDKVGAKSVTEAYNFAKRAAVYNGIPGEIGEEYVANGLKALTGVDDQHNVLQPLSEGDIAGALANFVQSMPFKETPAMAMSFGLIPASQRALELGVGGVQRTGRAIRDKRMTGVIQQEVGTPEARDRARMRQMEEAFNQAYERKQNATQKQSAVEEAGRGQAVSVPPVGGASGQAVPPATGAVRGEGAASEAERPARSPEALNEQLADILSRMVNPATANNVTQPERNLAWNTWLKGFDLNQPDALPKAVAEFNRQYPEASNPKAQALRIVRDMAAGAPTTQPERELAWKEVLSKVDRGPGESEQAWLERALGKAAPKAEVPPKPPRRAPAPTAEPTAIADATGFSYDAAMEQMVPQAWHFTDQRPDSPTAGLSVAVPKGASVADVQKVIQTKIEQGYTPSPVQPKWQRPTPLNPKERRSLEQRAEQVIAVGDEAGRPRLEARLERVRKDHAAVRKERDEAKTTGEKLRAEIELLELENELRKLAGEPELEISQPITDDDQRKAQQWLARRVAEVEAKIAAKEELTEQDRQDWRAAGRNPNDLPEPTTQKEVIPSAEEEEKGQVPGQGIVPSPTVTAPADIPQAPQRPRSIQPEAKKPERKEPWQMTLKEWESERVSYAGLRGPGSPHITNIAEVKPRGAAGTGDRVMLPDGSIWEYKGIGAYKVDNEGRINGWERVDESVYRRVDHKLAVQRAFDEGKPVPPRVLANYPDIAKGKPAKPAAPKPPKGKPANLDNIQSLRQEVRAKLGDDRYNAASRIITAIVGLDSEAMETAAREEHALLSKTPIWILDQAATLGVITIPQRNILDEAAWRGIDAAEGKKPKKPEAEATVLTKQEQQWFDTLLNGNEDQKAVAIAELTNIPGEQLVPGIHNNLYIASLIADSHQIRRLYERGIKPNAKVEYDGKGGFTVERIELSPNMYSLQVVLKDDAGNVVGRPVLDLGRLKAAVPETKPAPPETKGPSGETKPAKAKPEKPKKSDYPRVVDKNGYEHTIYGYGVHIVKTGKNTLGGTGWEYYALEPVRGDIVEGFVHGFEDEFGSFSLSELKEGGVRFTTDPAELANISPPIGWKKIETQPTPEQKPKPISAPVQKAQLTLERIKQLVDEASAKYPNLLREVNDGSLTTGVGYSSSLGYIGYNLQQLLDFAKFNASHGADALEHVRLGIDEEVAHHWDAVATQEQNEAQTKASNTIAYYYAHHAQYFESVPAKVKRAVAALYSPSGPSQVQSDALQMSELIRMKDQLNRLGKTTESALGGFKETGMDAAVQEIKDWNPAPHINAHLERIARVANRSRNQETISAPPAGLRELILSDATGQQKAAQMAKLAKDRNIALKDLQEQVELEIVRMSHEIARDATKTPRERFDALLNLYNRQPNLSARTSVSIANQAYSTPAPLAYALSYATGVTPQTEGYDATGGNGMLLIGMNLGQSAANELNDVRAANLKALGVGEVTQNDATKYTPDRKFDIVHLNPPFGSIPTTLYHNYRIGRLEHIVALKALEALADEGTAHMILGAKREEGEIGKGAQWVFENYVYGNYHVVANFEVAGELYAKQGASWPVRILVIAAKRQNPIGGELSPKEVDRVNTWDEVWTRVERIRNEVAAKRESLGAEESPGISVSPDRGETPAEDTGGISTETDTGVGTPAGGVQPGGSRGGKPKTPRGPAAGNAGFPADRPAGEPTNGELPPVQPDERGDETAPVEVGGKQPAGPSGDVTTASTGGSPKPGFGSVPGQSSVDRPAGDLSGLSDEEFNNIFDQAVAEVKAGKKPAPTQKPKPPGTPQTQHAPRPKATKPTIKKAAKEILSSADSAVKALDELFGGGKHMGSFGPSFSEETYQKAKPHFLASYNKAVAAGHTLLAWIKEAVARWGEVVKPYLQRFVQELKQMDRGPKPVPMPKAKPPSIKATEGQDVYLPGSNGAPFETLTPKNLSVAQRIALEKIQAEVGDIDAYVADKLHMDREWLWRVMAAEQIDGVALAIYQIENGNALVIGDETGIGKGRQAAALIRYARMNGKIPIFFTADAKLFTDMYGDLVDIGDQDTRPLIFGNPSDASIVDQDGDKIIRAPGLEVQKRAMREILANGMEAAGYNAIFSTYYQVSKRNSRQRFLEELAENNPVIVILDESHKASGDTGTSMSAAFISGGQVVKDGVGQSLPGLITRSGTKRGQGGVLYLSATYAKRAENMGVYFRTALGRAAQNIAQVVDAMKRGGVALQQAVSEALAQAGQYIRRERDFTGVRYDMEKISVESPEQLIEDVDQVTDVLSEIVIFSEQIRAAVQDANSGSSSTAQTQTQHDMTDFASIVHNQIGQLLLAAKADTVVSEVLKIAKNGEKPVIALMYTMESFLDQYTTEKRILPGAKITLTWSELLKYALDRCLRVTTTLPNGDKEISTINPADYGLEAFYRQIQRLADDVPSKFPISPIDYILQKIRAAGVSFGELTGRQSGIEYTDFEKGEGIYRRFKKANKNRVVNSFNRGEVVGMLLNASGSTGLSAHASVKVEDQRPRHMLIAQAATDVSTLVQTLGRIKRTGMVLLGVYSDGTKYGARYTHLILPLQAELRPAAMAARKLKSLNANTTSATDGMAKIDVEEIFNRYGDRVVSEYLDAHPEMERRTGLYIDVNQDGSVSVKRDVAKTFTGRMARMPDADQKAAYEEILPAYRHLIEQLKSTGEYDLEIVVHDDWDATLQSDAILAPGIDDSNYLTSTVRMQQWEIKDARHVPTGEEMQREFNKNLKSREAVNDEWETFKTKTTQVLTDRIQKLERDLAAASEEDQPKIQRNLDTARESAQRWQHTQGVIRDVLAYAGEPVQVKNSESGETFDGLLVNVSYPSIGRIAPSAFRFRFLMNTPGGSVFLSGSDLASHSWTHESSSEDLDSFKGKTTDSRYTRWFVSGNPIQAYDVTNGRGKVVRFKTNEGKTVTALIMPSNWGPHKLTTDPRVELVNGRAVAHFMVNFGRHNWNTFIPVEIGGGLVRITRDRWDNYELSTPAAQRTGGKVYTDPALQRITGTLIKRGNRMYVTVNRNDLPKVADRIMDITGRRFRAVGEANALIPMVNQSNQAAGGASPQRGAASLTEEAPSLMSVAQAQGIVRAWQKEHATAPEVELVNRPNWTQTGADGRQYGVRGWWNGNRIIVNLAYIGGEDQLRGVLEHERLHPLLDSPEGQEAIETAIAKELGKAEMDKLRTRYKQHMGESNMAYRRRVQAEWLARLKESNPTVWQRIVAAIRSFLAKFKLVTLTDEEIGRGLLRNLEKQAQGPKLLRTKNGAVSTQPGLIRVGGLPALSAYHGTPHKVDRFTTAKIGTGEGAQVYGWGLYFAEQEEVARKYYHQLSDPSQHAYNWLDIDERDMLKDRLAADGIPINVASKEDISSTLELMMEDPELDWSHEQLSRMESARESVENAPGSVYKVRLNVEPDELLDWDKPLSEQSEKVRAGVLRTAGKLEAGGWQYYYPGLPFEKWTGGQLYEAFSQSGGVRTTPKVLSERLASAGIKGIRYLDQGSRDQNRVTINGKGYKPTKYGSVPEMMAFAYEEGGGSIQGAVKYLYGMLSEVLDTATRNVASQARRSFEEQDLKITSVEPTYNYVIFNDADIEIIAENGRPISPAEAYAEQQGVQGQASLTDEPVEGGFDVQAYEEEIARALEAEEVPTTVMGFKDSVRAREVLNRGAGADFARLLFNDVGLDVTQRYDGFFELTDPTSDQESDGQRLLARLKELKADPKSPLFRGEEGAGGNAINSVRLYMTQDNLKAFSPELKRELYKVAQSEASHRGVMLSALRGNNKAVEYIARHVDVALNEEYSKEYGGEDVAKVVTGVLHGVDTSLTDEEIEEAIRNSEKLKELLDRLIGEQATGQAAGKAVGIIREILRGRWFDRKDIAKLLTARLVEFGATPEEAKLATGDFMRAFDAVFNNAVKRAIALLEKAMTADDRRKFGVGKRRGIWPKIVRAVEKGKFDLGWVLQRIAQQDGWTIPTDDDIAKVRALAEKIDELKKPTPEAIERVRQQLAQQGITASPEQIAAMAPHANVERIVDLKRQIETYWSRWTKPINLRTPTGRSNTVQAAYEFTAANLLFKLGFPFRQAIDVTTQALAHMPTRAIANAIVQHGGFKKGAGNAVFYADANEILKLAAKTQVEALRPALREFKEALKGTAEVKNVDRLLSGIGLFERVQIKADELQAAGKPAEAMTMRLFGLIRFSYRFASAMDNLQGVPQEWQELRTQAYRQFRLKGMSPAEARQKVDLISPDLKAEYMRAFPLAKAILEQTDESPTKARLESGTWHVVKGLAYQRMREADMPADDFEFRNRLLRSTVAWNESMTGVKSPGGVASTVIKAVGEWGVRFPPAAILTTPFGRFGNAIGTAMDRYLAFTPFGLVPSMFGAGERYVDPETGLAGRGASPWFRTSEDRAQRAVEAVIGSAIQGILIGLVLGGYIVVRNRWPKDKEERQLWEANGWRPGTAAIQLGDGKEIPISMNTGPFALVRGGLAAGGALVDVWKEKAKKQARLDAEAAKLGLPPGKVPGLSLADSLAIAAEAGWAALVGSRTASGLIGTITDYGLPNAQKQVAGTISPLVPMLPAMQEFSRMAGVQLESRAATVLDFLLPLPTSGAAKVNLLGDPTGTPSDLQRIVQVLTGGSYPGITSAQATQARDGYAALFGTGYRPPSIDPLKGHPINGEYRPFTATELQDYTKLRGAYLKEELIGLGPEPDRVAVQAAYQRANNRALAKVGVTVTAQQRVYSPTTQPIGMRLQRTAPRMAIPARRISVGRRLRAGRVRRPRSVRRTSLRALRPIRLPRPRVRASRRRVYA